MDAIGRTAELAAASAAWVRAGAGDPQMVVVWGRRRVGKTFLLAHFAQGKRAAAIALVPRHRGVGYCHHARFPGTGAGLDEVRKALGGLATDPPPGLGEHPLVWWLADPEH